MKLKNYLYVAALGTVLAGLTACDNVERHFPDYEGGTTVYFANQYPVRTLVLGNDEYDNSLDLQHKCAIYATMGGSYKGKKITLDVAVDNSLCNNLYFTDESGNAAEPVTALPSEYYSLLGNKIEYNGEHWGAIEVQFNDAFFADPKAIEQTYVVPLVINSQKGADHILTGVPATEGATPARTDAAKWATQPKDYVLYCVKYINAWDADYIRRGVDNVTENGKTTEVQRRDMSMVESIREYYTDENGNLVAGPMPYNPVNAKDEVVDIKTRNMTQSIFPVSFKTSDASKLCNLVLTFSGDKCTVSCEDEGVKATGSGEYITKGTTNPVYEDFIWGAKDRDILRLEYSVDFGDVKVSTLDTLVVRSRGTNKKVTFSPVYGK